MPLNWFYQISGNYVIAMVLYAVLIKLVLFPFGLKQQKNMVKQAALRPKEMAIRKRYAGRDDKKTQMKMQEDLQKLYQAEGFNPMAGCGPMLLQLPVIWILYRIVYGPLLYIGKAGKETLAYAIYNDALYTYVTPDKANLKMAAGTFMSIFPMILFVIFQKQLIEGVSTSALKG